MAKELEVKVPDIGDYRDVPVIDVLVRPGEHVDKDASLVTLESDKATMDVPAPEAGVVKLLRLKVGDRVSQGSAVLVLETGAKAASAAKPEAEPAAAPKPDEGAQAAPAAKPAEASKTPVAAPGAGAARGAQLDVKVPDIGDYHDVPVIEVLVKDGDSVDKDAPLITLESEKATMDVPAPQAGVVRGLRVKAGDKVSKGVSILTLETAADAGQQAAAAEKAVAQSPEAERAETKPAGGALGEASPPPPASPLPARSEAAALSLPHASPSVRRFARELGVDLAQIHGSGPRGRITRDDVQAYVKQALRPPAPAAPSAAPGGAAIPPIPEVDFSQFGPIEAKPLARIRKLSAAHLHRSWLNIPHVTQSDEADITELEAFRKSQNEESGAKLTLLPFVIKAVTVALRQYPEFNSSLTADGASLVMKAYCHIGFAADTPNGLVVPVVRDADRKGIVQLAQETAELARKAREGKLKPDEMKGGSFSISSLGGIGGSHFTPIINAPEVGILGVSRSLMKPVWDGKAFQPRLMLPLSLSYDHRVIDGAYAARFIVQLVKLLSDLRRLSL